MPSKKDIPELLARGRPVFSFEFFLPRAHDDLSDFFRRVGAVRKLPVEFVTLTYRADGSSGLVGIETAGRIKGELGLEVASHLTCLMHTKEEISAILDRLRALEIGHIIALRGDRPKQQTPMPAARRLEPGTRNLELGTGRLEGRDFKHAVDLVRLISARGNFRMGVAGYPETHPEAVSAEEDVSRLAEKVRAGGNWVITQLFFDNKSYFDFVRRARAAGISVPIVPGILPITNYAGLKKFVSLCGAKLPADLDQTLVKLADDEEALRRFGVEYGVKQCRELLAGGAPGVHFYTLNNTTSSETILAQL